MAGGLVVVLCWPTLSWAEPQGGRVVRGKAEITPGDNLVVNQRSRRAVINWQSFDIGEQQSVTFIQPSARAVTLNRVTGGDPSNILGKLTANGQVTLVNRSGINFGRSARVDVGGLVATTANITNQDFMNGRDRFLEPGLASSSVVNQGEITVGAEVAGPDGTTVREGGLAAFVAPWVVNSGTINARLGVVTLASGDRFTIDLFGDRLVQLGVKPTIVAAAFGLEGVEAPEALVTVAQEGVIKADGGKVVLDAGSIQDVGTLSLDVASAQSIVNHAINMEGLVEARTVDTTGGQIVLRGGNAGPVRVAGKLDASGPETGQHGGEVVFEGTVPPQTTQAVIDVSGAQGDGRIESQVMLTAAVAQAAVESDVGLQSPALQERIDRLLGENKVVLARNNIPVANDRKPRGATLTLIAEDASFLNDNEFGIHDSNGGRIALLPKEAKPGDQISFTITPGADNTFTVSVDGEVRGTLAGRDYGYYLDTSGRRGGGLFFSDPSRNPEPDKPLHLGNFNISGFSYTVEDAVPQLLQGQQQPRGSRLLLWEDLSLPLDAPEPDFNDFIINVRADANGGGGGGGGDGGGDTGVLPGDCSLIPCVETDPPPVIADDGANPPGDPWDRCESWRDDSAKADIDVARCYAALTLETLGAHARTAFAELSGVLADASPRNRARAARDLGRISASLNAATSVLIGVLANPDPEVSAQAAAIIRDAREYADLVVPVLTKAADDEEVVVARAALQGLGDLGSYATTALPTFAGAFASEDLGVRYYAADGISKVDREMRETAIAIGAVGGTDQDLVPDLETALQDRPQYSRAAIDTLATIGDKAREDAPRWVDQLGTSDPTTRIAAVEALGDINRFAAASVPALVAALADPENQELRQNLTMPGEEPGSYVSVAVTPLVQALNDREPQVRRTTAQALRQLNAVAAESEMALRASPGDDRIVRRITTNTLATIDEYDRLATEALLAALKDDDVAVQRAAAQGLGALGPEAGDAVPGLIEAMKSGDADLQIAAGLALGRIGADPEQTVPTLVQALESADQPAVRYQAARALGLLGAQAQSAAPALLAAMKEGDAGLRYQTALALRTIDPAADLDPALAGENRQQVEQEVERLLIAAKGENPDAMLTLASIGPAALPAIPEIVATMDTAPEQRTELGALLRAISTEGMAEVPPLIETLQTGEPAGRARAAGRLGRISADAKKAVPALTGGLSTEDLEMRFALAEALGEIGGHTTATTRALVAAAAGDASSQVRQEATESLRREARAALEAEGVSTRRGLYEIDRALTN